MSIFAVIGDCLKPKSFAGLFGSAPSIALATLSLAVIHNGKAYASIEARSMVLGAIAFCVSAWLASWLLMSRKFGALQSTAISLPVWVGCAVALWVVLLR